MDMQQHDETNPDRARKDCPLKIAGSDPERWLGVPSGYGTSVNTGFAGIIALVLTVCVFLALYWSPASRYRDFFLDRGPTQHASVFFGIWSGVILLIKRRKLKVQRRALQHTIMPMNHDFVLTRLTADQIIRSIYATADDPQRFIVFHRILIALSSLKNLGRVSDVDDILRTTADRDESILHTSFSILGGFLWAIPVFGFIGTVLGLASAIGNFSELLDKQSEVSGIIGSLKEVTGGLSTAFETTLLALVIALLVQLWITAQRKAEEVFLEDCQDYCLKQIVSRVKILPHEEGMAGT